MDAHGLVWQRCSLGAHVIRCWKRGSAEPCSGMLSAGEGSGGVQAGPRQATRGVRKGNTVNRLRRITSYSYSNPIRVFATSLTCLASLYTALAGFSGRFQEAGVALGHCEWLKLPLSDASRHHLCVARPSTEKTVYRKFQALLVEGWSAESERRFSHSVLQLYVSSLA